VPIIQEETQDIVQREVGKAEIEVVHDREDFQIHILRNGEHLFVRKSDGWEYVARPDEHGVHRTEYDFGPSDVPKLLPCPGGPLAI
jgi:hypothetical protein